MSMSRDLRRSSLSFCNNTTPPSVQDASTFVNGVPVTHDTFAAAAPPRQKKRKLSSDDTSSSDKEHGRHHALNNGSDDTPSSDQEHGRDHAHNNGYGYASPCHCPCHVSPRCCGCPRLDSYPKGYRFCPKDDELLSCYLLKKVKKEELPENRIFEVNIYKDGPEIITEKYQKANEGEWYFFSPRERKYPNGERPKRNAGNGYWKATGPDKEFKENGRKTGAKKSLVYYIGKSPHGEKTDWMMQEYVLNGHEHQRTDKLDMKLDDYVLCKIYKKHEKGGKKPEEEADADVATEQVAPPRSRAPVENHLVDQQNHFNRDMHHQNSTQFPSYDPPPAHLAFSIAISQMRGEFSTPPFVNQIQNQNHPYLSSYHYCSNFPNRNPNPDAALLAFESGHHNHSNLPNPNPDAALLAFEFESGGQQTNYQQQSFRCDNRSILPTPPSHSVYMPPAAVGSEHQPGYQQGHHNRTILPNLLHPDAAVDAFGHGQHEYLQHPFMQPASGPFLHPHYRSSVAALAPPDQSYLDPRVESYWDGTNSNCNLPTEDDDMGIGLQDLDEINGNWGNEYHSLQNEMNHETPKDSLSGDIRHDDDQKADTD